MQLKAYYLFFIILLCSCNTVVNTLYDDTTARYNAYFIANEVISEIENELYESAEYNYDSLINLTYEIDTNRVSGLKDKKNKIIQKLSILIQRHPESKYVYPSYALIGKSRLLALDMAQAITTLKYVNSKTNNSIAKQMSLIYLMRAYTEKDDYSAALEVNSFLKKVSLEKSLLTEYYLNAHYLYKKINDLKETLNILFELEKIVKNRRLINKVYFAIGQIYLIQNEYDTAGSYFQKCLKNNPSFEMEFNAKIFYSKSLLNSSETDIKKYFEKLIKDKKNEDKLDRVYYELGLFNLKKENYNKAIDNFKVSISSIINKVNLIDKHNQSWNSYLSCKKDMLSCLRHWSISTSNNQDTSIHLCCTSYHIFYIICVTRTINVSVMSIISLIFNMRSIYCNTPFFFFKHYYL